MTRRRVRIVLAFCALWLLAVILPSLRFENDGFKGSRQVITETLAFSKNQNWVLAFIAVILIIGLIYLIGKLVVSLWKARRRKDSDERILYIEPLPTSWQVYPIIAFLLLGVAGLVHLARQSPDFIFPITAPQKITETPEDTNTPNPPLSSQASADNRGQAPNLNWPAYSLAIILFLALCRIVRIIVQNRLQAEKGLSENSLARLAGKAITDLENGAALSDVVLCCYRDMGMILDRKVNFRKEMTAREFEQALGKAGVSENAVVTLTHLFERVRYGSHLTVPEDRVNALTALKAIEEKYKESEHAV